MKIKILPNPELLQEIKSNIPDAVEVIIPFWGDNTCFDIGSDFDSIEAYDENDNALYPDKQDDSTNPHTGKCNTDREPPLTMKPIRQKHRMTNVADEYAAADHQEPEGQIELPQGARPGCQNQTGRHHDSTNGNRNSWPETPH